MCALRGSFPGRRVRNKVSQLPGISEVSFFGHGGYLSPEEIRKKNQKNHQDAMSLKEKLAEDLKAAMRAKDAVRLRTIRSLRAALMEREIAERQGGEATLTEEQELAVVQKQAKQRRDALEQYEQAGREDLAAKEREELEVLKEYLPRQLGEDEVRTVVARIVAETGAASPRDMGKVMGLAMKELRGKADGRMVQAVARELLSESE